jgi:hypothetical protein
MIPNATDIRREEHEDPRLYAPDAASWNSDDRYATLSHCWSSKSNQAAKLDTGNLDALR